MTEIITEKKRDCLIKCRIQPSASKTAISGIHDNSIKITLAAPPVDGKANKELRNFISKKLKISKSKIDIVRGIKSRSKILLCEGISKKEIEKLLEL